MAFSDHVDRLVAYQGRALLEPSDATHWTGVWALYWTHQAVFSRAIARLRRQGWEISSDLEVDLIHEFLLRKARSVLAAFDPQLGSSEGLVFLAFQRFVFSELRTERAQQQMLQSIEAELSASVTTTAPTLDTERVQMLIKQLEPAHAEAIRTLAMANGSVRRVAAVLGVSRWTARKRLLAALRSMSETIGRGAIDPVAVLRALSRTLSSA